VYNVELIGRRHQAESLNLNPDWNRGALIKSKLNQSMESLPSLVFGALQAALKAATLLYNTNNPLCLRALKHTLQKIPSGSCDVPYSQGKQGNSASGPHVIGF